MFKVGDLIIYSGQGICHIDDICEMSFVGETKDYYVLHPIENVNLKISIPVDNEKVVMMDLINQEEAEEIIESFSNPGAEWIEIASHRTQAYSEEIKKANRTDIAKIINTLMRKKYQTQKSGKKFYEKDSELLNNTKNVLFAELAMSLKTTFEHIEERITALIAESE
jgi:CarD family transcriptional regulator